MLILADSQGSIFQHIQALVAGATAGMLIMVCCKVTTTRLQNGSIFTVMEPSWVIIIMQIRADSLPTEISLQVQTNLAGFSCRDTGRLVVRVIIVGQRIL